MFKNRIAKNTKAALLLLACSALFPAHLLAQAPTVYRTFQASELTVNSPVQPISKGSMWEFHITNNTGATVSGLYVHFFSTLVHLTQYSPFSDVHDRPWIDGVEYTFFSGGTVPPGGEAVVAGNSRIPLAAILSAYWMNDQGLIVGAPMGVMSPSMEAAYIPMPNTANVRNAMYVKSAAGGVAPIVVGIPQKTGHISGAWVTLKTPNTFLLSLIDGTVTHEGAPHGLDYTDKGEPLIGAHTSLSPSLSNNELFAQLVAFKFNLAVSATAIGPGGLGSLTYYEPGHVCSGMTLDSIAHYADSMMTYCWTFSSTDFFNIDYVVHKINSAFDGPIDTVSFVSSLKLTGVTGAAIGTYLFAPGMPLPVTHGSLDLASKESAKNAPEAFRLKANYPNPFNPTTTISFDLAAPSVVTLTVYNELGQVVATLLNKESFSAGESHVQFDASNLPSGIYFDRITATGQSSTASVVTQVNKMVLLK
jgi:hypothetical protein